MKNQIKMLLLLVIVLFFQISFSQKKKAKAKSKPKTEKVEAVEYEPEPIAEGNAVFSESSEIVLEAATEAPPPPPPSIQGDGGYSRYATERINNQAVWFYDRYNTNNGYKYGIKKEAKFFFRCFLIKIHIIMLVTIILFQWE